MASVERERDGRGGDADKCSFIATIARASVTSTHMTRQVFFFIVGVVIVFAALSFAPRLGAGLAILLALYLVLSHSNMFRSIA